MNENDILIRYEDAPWVTLSEGVAVKFLRFCDRTGQWTQILKLSAGASLPSHYHLGAGEFIVLRGELHYSSGVAKPLDYGYEALGAIHEKTFAPVETELFYLGHGPLGVRGPNGELVGIIDGRPTPDFFPQ